EHLSVRAQATEVAALLDRRPKFVGEEAATALLSDASRMIEKLGKPSTSASRLLAWTAEWISGGGRVLAKPTHFEVRDGTFCACDGSGAWRAVASCSMNGPAHPMPHDPLRRHLLNAQVIPAPPLLRPAARTLDDRRQRKLTQYYINAGAGGVAVAVHTTQFALRQHGLLRPVLELASTTAAESRLG